MGGCDLSLDRHLSEVVRHKAFLYSTTQHTPVQLDIMKLGRELLLAVVVFCVLPSFPSPFLSSPHGLYDLYYILHAAFFTTSKHLFHLLPDGCISLASQFTHTHTYPTKWSKNLKLQFSMIIYCVHVQSPFT